MKTTVTDFFACRLRHLFCSSCMRFHWQLPPCPGLITVAAHRCAVANQPKPTLLFGSGRRPCRSSSRLTCIKPNFFLLIDAPSSDFCRALCFEQSPYRSYQASCALGKAAKFRYLCICLSLSLFDSAFHKEWFCPERYQKKSTSLVQTTHQLAEWWESRARAAALTAHSA